MWSSLEVSLDVVAECLPVIAPGLYRVFRSGGLNWSHLKPSYLFSKGSTGAEKTLDTAHGPEFDHQAGMVANQDRPKYPPIPPGSSTDDMELGLKYGEHKPREGF